MLLGGLMPHSDVEELVKIPALWQHYFEHKAQDNPNLTFFQFVRDHYSDTCSSEKAHDNLPFVKHTLPCLVFLIPDFKVRFQQSFELLVQVAIPYQFSCISNFSAISWQPPRIG